MTRRATVPEIQPFEPSHSAGAARLLARSHAAHRGHEPLLAERFATEEGAAKEIARLLDQPGAEGAVALEGDRVTGYLIGCRLDERVWGPNVWMPAGCLASETPETLRDIYGVCAASWVDSGRHRHYAVVPASDRALVEVMFRLSFGHQQTHAVMDVHPAEMPAGVRVATTDDLDGLLELSKLLPEHQARSPVFGPGALSDPEEERSEWEEDLIREDIAVLVTGPPGRPTGVSVVAPTELSSMHEGIARPDDSAYLAFAVTRPEVRGTGAGVLLSHASVAWAAEAGFRSLVTDWRETNLLSSRFWPARGFRPTFLRLYRSIP